MTAKRTVLAPNGPKNHRTVGTQAYHTLEFKLDHSVGADQEGEITVRLKGKEPMRLTKGGSIYFDSEIGHAYVSGSQEDSTAVASTGSWVRLR